MLINSSLLVWTVIQVIISGSETKPHAAMSEDDVCFDISSNCAIHAFQCDTSHFVQGRCQKTCNLCTDTTIVPPTTTEVTIPPTTEPTTTTVADPPTTPPSECGGDYTSRSGTIRYPMNGSSYQNNENCVWTITTGEPITITFVSFDIEDSYDYLIISDGRSNDSRILGNYTGSSLPSPVEANSEAAYLRFTSDRSVTETGFVLQWETSGSECGGDYTSRSGTIRHPMNGSSYQNNENCVWTITTEEPIKITFVSFDIEDSYDYLFISGGSSIDTPVLGNFTGSSLPSPVETNSGAAYLLFTSDISVTETGFVLQWETLDACVDISPHCAIHAFQCNTSTFVQGRCQKTCNLCGKCPTEFVQNNGNCFHFSSDSANWSQARTKCQTLGRTVGKTADLAELGNSEKWLMDQITAKNTRFWLGASDPNHNNHWVWTHSRRILPSGRSSYAYWHPNEPNNLDGDEFCLDTLPNGSRMELNDESCHDVKPYVCQIFN